MSCSREDSPDWLRSFQAPTLTLSSDSNSSPNLTPSRDHRTITSPFSDPPSNYKLQGDVDDGQVSGELSSPMNGVKHSVYALSSDSENDKSPLEGTEKYQFKESALDEEKILLNSRRASPNKKALKGKSPKKRAKVGGQTLTKEKTVNENVLKKGSNSDMEVPEECKSEKHINPHVSTSRLPLVLSEKVQRSKALIECEGESIDLSGDVGAVGRIVIPDTPSGNADMYLDLKGTIYRTTIVPSRTFCVVSFGQSEAKIEAIMNDFIQLKPQSNVYEAETMVEGTLDGFSFDSEDEADKMGKAISHHTGQNEGIEEQTNGNTKGRAEKSSGAGHKKGKTAGRKLQPAKKVRKKTQVSKKAKANK